MVKQTKLPYTVHKRNTRTGKLEWWFRRHKRWKLLPGDPGKSEEAARVYWEMRAGKHDETARPTFDALIKSYRKSPR